MDTNSHTTPPSDDDQTACRLVATDLTGRRVDWTELVRAVFDGQEDPDAYHVTAEVVES